MVSPTQRLQLIEDSRITKKKKINNQDLKSSCGVKKANLKKGS